MPFPIGKRSLVACSLVAGLLMAAHPAAADSLFRGAYAGLQGSYDTYDFDVRANSLTADDLSLSGPSGGFYAGANTGLPGTDRMIVGLEGSFTFNDADGQISGGGDRTTINARNTYGISGRAGYEVTDSVLLYGRLGWARTRFSGLGQSGGASLDGVRFGGGAEYAISDNLALRTEFTRTEYERRRSNGGRFEPEQNQLTVGLGFHF